VIWETTIVLIQDCDDLYYMFDIQELFQVAENLQVIQTLFLVEVHYRKIM
jgi:hypothetical protein